MTTYDQLLTAAIEHLQHLRAKGVHFVRVSPASLSSLSIGRFPQLTPAKPQFTPSASTLTNSFAELKRAAEPVREKAFTAQPLPPRPVSFPAETSAGQSTAEGFDQLRPQVLACTKCPHLVASRKKVVFGVGDVQARLMFIGEAPGADEDAQGEPFVGRAGQLLTRIIETMGLSRQKVYIANILKCRPDTPGQATGNRKPTPAEMATCIPWLHQQIDLIKPEVIVALGATAVEGLLGSCPSITRMRGKWQTYRNIPMMPTFHPSFLLRPDGGAHKRQVWEDMLQVLAKLGMPITEKQQGYFLKK